MYKIGEFARLAQISIRVLRHYDEIGLLVPACVDRSTGYRYYAVDQLQRLHRILALKDLGLSLDQILYLLDEALTADEIRGMLLLKRAELRQRVADEQIRLARVEQRLKRMDEEGALPETDVVLKSVPPLHVISVHRALPRNQNPAALFEEASAALRACHLRERVELLLGIYHNTYLSYRRPDVQVKRYLFEAVYVIDPDVTQGVTLASGSRMRVRDIPGFDVVASAVHRGPDHVRHLAHQFVRRWVEAHGYRLAGAGREVYLYRDETNCEDHVTEVQYPLET
jgi:DNA-binding transcriptional MerR regulator/effector-binding domain-containing protein